MMNENKYKKQYESLELLDINMYNNIFPQNIRTAASALIECNKLKDFKQIDSNEFEAIASGTYDYIVNVKLNDDLSLDNYSCECAHYINTDHHCKHIYALLNKIFTEKNNVIIQKQYDLNIDNLGKLLKKLDLIIKKNKDKVNDAILGNWINSVHESINKNYKSAFGIKICGMNSRDSYYALNESLSMLDEAKEEIKKVEESLNEYYEDEKDDNDTEIIDKASKNSIKNKEEQKKSQRKNRGLGISLLFSGFASALSGKSGNKKNDINNYESYNYEEEELEDDDFYHDDLD